MSRAGKTKRAILRCLKRFIAREIYSHLVNPKPAIRTHDLRAGHATIWCLVDTRTAFGEEWGISEVRLARSRAQPVG